MECGQAPTPKSYRGAVRASPNPHTGESLLSYNNVLVGGLPRQHVGFPRMHSQLTQRLYVKELVLVGSLTEGGSTSA